MNTSNINPNPSENTIENQKIFTISCCDKLFKVPKKFIEKCSYFKNMIEDTYCFNQPLNKWNTKRVADMAHMFSGAKSYKYKSTNNFDKKNIVLDSGSYVKIN